MILAGTGHRPRGLGLSYSVADLEGLSQFLEGHLRDIGPSAVISGCALGFDQALAIAALRLGIPLDAAVPFEGFEGRWMPESCRIHARILKKARSVHFVSPPGYESWKFAERDRYMVDRCDRLLALFSGRGGSGTGITVEYARSKGIPVENLWDDWQWAGEQR